VVASAEVTRQCPPGLQVADAVLDADPLGGLGLAFAACVAATAGRAGSWLVRPGRPWGDDRAGGLRAQAQAAGVGEQGDAWHEGQQLDQADLTDLDQIMNGARSPVSRRSWARPGRRSLALVV
jgi:hypothetical protein